MLSLLIAATVVSSPPQIVAQRQAQASVRIVRGAEIRLQSPVRFDASIVRSSTVRESDGATRTASLIEFY